MDAAELFSALAEIYPADRLLTSNAALTPYETDGLTAFRVKPAAVVLPENQQEVIQTVRICQRCQVPFMARGSGTSLSGARCPSLTAW